MASTVIDRATGVALISAIKAPCVAATTANITLYGEQTIDGVAVFAGDRVLVKNQTVAAENGILVVDTGGWDRAPDFDSSRDIQQYVRVYIGAGSENAGTEWVLTTENPIPDTTALAFARIQAGGLTAQLDVPTFATRANVGSSQIQAGTNAIRIAGWSTAGDGGGWNLAVRRGTVPSHTGYVQSADGAYWELVDPVVTPQQFGAKGDSTAVGSGTNDYSAIVAWFAYLLARKAKGLLTAFYRSSSTLTFDFSGSNAGVIISGVGLEACGFNMDATKRIDLVGANTFYWQVMDFRVAGNYAGPLVRVGKDDFSDAHNGINLRLNITNASLSSSMEAMRLNYVLFSEIFVVANGGGSGRPTGAPGGPNANDPGYGTAVKIRQACFNLLQIAAGQANVGISLTGAGAIFSNTFVALDIEEVHTGLLIDAASAANNLFTSGQILGAVPYDASAGRNNVLDTGCNISTYGTGAGPGAHVGLELRSGAQRVHVATPAPTMPASGTSWPNPYPYKVMVVIWAATTISTLVTTAADGGAVSRNPQVAGEDVFVVLHPGWSFTATYIGSPVMRVYPL